MKLTTNNQPVLIERCSNRNQAFGCGLILLVIFIWTLYSAVSLMARQAR
jgi:hypothetical protein